MQQSHQEYTNISPEATRSTLIEYHLLQSHKENTCRGGEPVTCKTQRHHCHGSNTTKGFKDTTTSGIKIICRRDYKYLIPQRVLKTNASGDDHLFKFFPTWVTCQYLTADQTVYHTVGNFGGGF